MAMILSLGFNWLASLRSSLESSSSTGCLPLSKLHSVNNFQDKIMAMKELLFCLDPTISCVKLSLYKNFNKDLCYHHHAVKLLCSKRLNCLVECASLSKKGNG